MIAICHDGCDYDEDVMVRALGQSLIGGTSPYVRNFSEHTPRAGPPAHVASTVLPNCTVTGLYKRPHSHLALGETALGHEAQSWREANRRAQRDAA